MSLKDDIKLNFDGELEASLIEWWEKECGKAPVNVRMTMDMSIGYAMMNVGEDGHTILVTHTTTPTFEVI